MKLALAPPGGTPALQNVRAKDAAVSVPVGFKPALSLGRGRIKNSGGKPALREISSDALVVGGIVLDRTRLEMCLSGRPGGFCAAVVCPPSFRANTMV